MSVRMALAKLCACTCGGAIIGGSAVHVAEGAPARSHVERTASASHSARGYWQRTTMRRSTYRAHGRLVRRTVRRIGCAAPTQTVTRTIIPPMFAPPPPPPVLASSGGSGGMVVVGGSSGGFGFGGGFFSGGFFGGSSSSGGTVITIDNTNQQGQNQNNAG